MTESNITTKGKTAGYKSTEFWIVIALTIFTALATSGVIPLGSEWVELALVVANLVAGTAYVSGRSAIKKAMMQAIAATEKAHAETKANKNQDHA